MNDFLLMVAGALFAMFVSGIVNYKKSTWTGLTDEDELDWEEGGNLKDLVKAIEAKLKEKNT
jgi:hypothetical protein